MWKLIVALDRSPLLPIRRVKILEESTFIFFLGSWPLSELYPATEIASYKVAVADRWEGVFLRKRIYIRCRWLPGPSLSCPEMGATVNNSNFTVGFLPLAGYFIPPIESMIPNRLKPITHDFGWLTFPHPSPNFYKVQGLQNITARVLSYQKCCWSKITWPRRTS